MEKHYGFLQNVHGSDKLYVFSESELLNEWGISKEDLPIKKNEPEIIPLFPVGGSNSNDSTVRLLETEDDVKEFICNFGFVDPEPDYEDAPLVALAEYYFEIVTDTGCAGEWIERLGLDKEELEESAMKEVEYRCSEICKKLRIELKNFYDDEWREVRESEVDDIANNMDFAGKILEWKTDAKADYDRLCKNLDQVGIAYKAKPAGMGGKFKISFDYSILDSDDYSLIFTDHGKKITDEYVEEMKAKRKEILDAGKDTADETEIPEREEILSDAVWGGVDSEGEYVNGWGVTDNYDSDYPLLLKLGRDLLIKKTEPTE